MPTLETNRILWETDYDWSEEGEEWSAWCGGSRLQWFTALLPRIQAFVPTGTVLEIAPGHGRWTQYLRDQCVQLIAVDLSPSCIAHCRQRFADAPNLAFHVNDGRSLSAVAEASIDFVFSFDSLVHVEDDVLADYLAQLAGKLTADGVGFVHHSNAGAYRSRISIARRVPQPLRASVVRVGALPNPDAGRAESGSARSFRRLCRQAGLSCVSQELINHDRGPYLLDVLSVFTRPGSRWDRTPQIVRNRGYAREIRRQALVYGHAPGG